VFYRNFKHSGANQRTARAALYSASRSLTEPAIACRLGHAVTIPSVIRFCDAKPLFGGSPHVWFQSGNGHAWPARSSRTLTQNRPRRRHWPGSHSIRDVGILSESLIAVWLSASAKSTFGTKSAAELDIADSGSIARAGPVNSTSLGQSYAA
jgi:hypothetical protein